MTTLVTTIEDVRAEIAARRQRLPDTDSSRVVLVPTMGALHAGHHELIHDAAEMGGVVVVSIFVNPLQFGAGEDLDRYPRTLQADVAALTDLADIVFAPSVDEMYPHGEPTTRVVPGEVASTFEGAARPGHFEGVLTVVAKFLGIIQPDVAVFGRKDAQQVFLVGRMVADLNLPVTIAVVDTVRERDGLALSSRNRFLEGPQRDAAVAFSAALRAATRVQASGVDAALRAATARIAEEPAVKLDYLAIVDPDTFREVGSTFCGPALAIIAGHVGHTRLIDNERVVIGPQHRNDSEGNHHG